MMERWGAGRNEGEMGLLFPLRGDPSAVTKGMGVEEKQIDTER